MAGVVDPKRPGFDLSGSVEGLEICPEFRDSLPGPLAARLGVLQGVRGQGEMSFHVAYDAAAPVPLQFSVAGQLTRGRIDDPRLPHPLSDIRAVVRLDNSGFAVKELTGRSNQATLRMSASGKFPGPGQPLWLAAEVRQLELDRPLFDALPEKPARRVAQVLPAGTGRCRRDAGLRRAVLASAGD